MKVKTTVKGLGKGTFATLLGVMDSVCTHSVSDTHASRRGAANRRPQNRSVDHSTVCSVTHEARSASWKIRCVATSQRAL
jgi:hypothetical protein